MIKTLAPIEESHCQASPNATEAVNRAGIHRVINLQFLEKHGGKLVDNASHQSSSEGGTTFHASTACCDGDQACKDTIAQATDIVLLRDEIAKDKHGDSTCGSSKSRVHRHLCCQSTIACALHREGGPWVEAIPAEPKRESSQHHQRKIVAVKLLCKAWGMCVSIVHTAKYTPCDGLNPQLTRLMLNLQVSQHPANVSQGIKTAYTVWRNRSARKCGPFPKPKHGYSMHEHVACR